MSLRDLLTTALTAALLGGGLGYAARVSRERDASRLAAEPTPVVQAAPRVTIVGTCTERRVITGPTDLVERIADAPEHGDVLKVTDRLSRADGLVTLAREIVRPIESLVPLRRASLDAALAFPGGATSRVYDAAFGAVYTWENPTDAPAEMRIVVPLPQGGGDLSGFRLQIGLLDIMDPDPDGRSYSWSGTIPAHGRVTTEVAYHKVGAGTYRYEPGGDRYEAFEFRARGDRSPTVPPTSAAPTEKKGTAVTWSRGGVQSDAALVLSYPVAPMGDAGRDRALEFAPIALAVFALGAWALRPERGALATLGFGAGLAGIAVLGPYLPATAAVVAGAGVAALLGAAAVGRSRGIFIGLLGGLLAAAPALVGNATLAIWGLGLLTLGPVTRVRREAPASASAYVA